MLPDLPPEQPPLSTEERLTLIQSLTALPAPQVAELIFVLGLPPSNQPGRSASTAEQIQTLLTWVQSPMGPGLAAVQGVLEAILNPAQQVGAAPPPITSPVPAAQFLDLPEGSMDAESAFYIRRAEDATALTALQRQGGTVTILGPRQVGKSSLLIQAMAQARRQQKKVAFLDFQRLEAKTLTDADLFYRRFCEWITLRLRLPSQVEQFWATYQAMGNPLRCTYYVQDYLLEGLDGPIFLAMDEVDKLIGSPFRDEFFSMLRSWHNERAFEPTWKQLDLAMVTCTEPYQLIQDLNQSPFNVGTSITLTDFSEAEVAELNRRHQNVLSLKDLALVMNWLGGHPYLTRKALYEVASQGVAVANLFDLAAVDQGPFGGHLRYHLFRMDDKPNLVRGMVQVIGQHTCDDEQVLRRLERAGLVRRVGRKVEPRCRLYGEYFGEHLS